MEAPGVATRRPAAAVGFALTFLKACLRSFSGLRGNPKHSAPRRPTRKIRLGIIGNSHVVALKLGWDAAELADAFDPTFFAAGAGRLALRIEGSQLVADEAIAEEVSRVSGGRTAIDVQDHDAFLIVGLMLRLRSVVELYASHRLPEHADENHQVISRPLLDQAAHRVLADSPACQILKQLRQISSAPCVLVTEPLPSLDISTSPETAVLWDGAYIPFLYSLYRECLRRIAEEHGVEIVTQPDSMIAPPCFTPALYSVGSTNLKQRPHRTTERFHMNATYGTELLGSVLAEIFKKAAAPSSARRSS